MAQMTLFDNFLPKALFVSVLLHSILFTAMMFVKPPRPHSAIRQRVEIDYRPEARKRQIDVKQHPVKPAQQLDLKNAPIASGTIPLKLGGERPALSRNFVTDDRRPEQIRSAQMAHRIRIVPLKSEKINNPAYTSYNEMVRSRIEEKVYENYRRMDGGSVYLTFVVGRDGKLRAAQIIGDKTNASTNLQEISLLSLKQANFPSFLKGMTLPEYTFNIEIQYQVKD